ncbi:DUF6081 family protein [Streptomyces polygonati]|uniref:DUF6081 family protein n=1 Tax=Streptomyces polygonati TaxID=1617087 RepID=A0ABV8HHT2_9ACTN
MRRTRTAGIRVLAVLAAVAFLPAAPAEAGPHPSDRTLFHDDFRSGFDTTTTWLPQSSGGLPAGDGIPSTSGAGLTVVPTGTNPATGRPAFVATSAQDSAAGGTADHVKWLAFPQHIAGTGLPGFDVPATGSLTCSITMSGRSYGVDRQPFGPAVTDPHSDVRLAAADMVTADFETNAVFDWSVTDTRIYAVYERLRTPGSSYAAYSYAVPIARRTPGEQDAYAVRIDKGGTRVTWLLNGKAVMSTARIGYRVFDRADMLMDHGGTEQPVTLRQLTCGMGMFTVLDATGPDGRALVKLDSTPGFYYSTLRGQPRPQTFVDTASLASDRLWGQGEVLKVRSVDVTARG